MTFTDMAGPVELEEDAITRPWPSRFSISEEGLEAVVHCLRRHKPAECRRMAKELGRAFEIEPPY